MYTGQHHLFVNIHDAYRARGLSRTLPHLLTQEGVRGEERKPDGDHHVLLTLVRYLAGKQDDNVAIMRACSHCDDSFVCAGFIESCLRRDPRHSIG